MRSVKVSIISGQVICSWGRHAVYLLDKVLFEGNDCGGSCLGVVRVVIIIWFDWEVSRESEYLVHSWSLFIRHNLLFIEVYHTRLPLSFSLAYLKVWLRRRDRRSRDVRERPASRWELRNRLFNRLTKDVSSLVRFNAVAAIVSEVRTLLIDIISVHYKTHTGQLAFHVWETFFWCREVYVRCWVCREVIS